MHLTQVHPNAMAPLVEELPFHEQLHVPVSIQRITTVLPASPTPSTPLFLSHLDDPTGNPEFMTTIYLYKKPSSSTTSKPPAQILREALAEVLVPYYPFSGRLGKNGPSLLGQHHVYFPPEEAGTWFVEGYTDMTISELGPLNIPNPSWRTLAYPLPQEEPSASLELPLLIAQVTMFRCGGFSLGLHMSHAVCDGMGAMQFMAAWAATARTGSAEAVDPTPCWERDFFRAREPPRVEFPHRECRLMEEGSNLDAILADGGLVHRGYRLSREFQARIKQLGAGTGGCTTFDKLAAHVWRCWVKAWGVQPADSEVQLQFSVDVRRRLADPPLPSGFYGNAICIVSATATVRQLLEGPLLTTAGSIHAARSGATADYVRSAVDFIEERRPIANWLRGKMMLAQWTRLSMYESTDFGLGRPVYLGPCFHMPHICLLLPENDELAEDGGGAIVVWICMTKETSPRFVDCLLQIPQQP